MCYSNIIRTSTISLAMLLFFTAISQAVYGCAIRQRLDSATRLDPTLAGYYIPPKIAEKIPASDLRMSEEAEVSALSTDAEDTLRMPAGEVVNALSMHAEGMRALVILGRLHKTFVLQNQLPIIDQFDVLVGSDMGGVIAMALANGKSVEELIDIFSKSGEQMFKKSGGGKVGRKIFGRKKYSTDTYEQFLREQLFGEAKLTDLRIPVVVAARDAELGNITLFANFRHGDTAPSTVKMTEIARATTVNGKNYGTIRIRKKVYRSNEGVVPTLIATLIAQSLAGERPVKVVDIDGGVVPQDAHKISPTRMAAKRSLSCGASELHRIRTRLRNDRSPSVRLPKQLDALRYAVKDAQKDQANELARVASSIYRGRGRAGSNGVDSETD